MHRLADVFTSQVILFFVTTRNFRTRAYVEAITQNRWNIVVFVDQRYERDTIRIIKGMSDARHWINYARKG